MAAAPGLSELIGPARAPPSNEFARIGGDHSQLPLIEGIKFDIRKALADDDNYIAQNIADLQSEIRKNEEVLRQDNLTKYLSEIYTESTNEKNGRIEVLKEKLEERNNKLRANLALVDDAATIQDLQALCPHLQVTTTLGKMQRFGPDKIKTCGLCGWRLQSKGPNRYVDR